MSSEHPVRRAASPWKAALDLRAKQNRLALQAVAEPTGAYLLRSPLTLGMSDARCIYWASCDETGCWNREGQSIRK